MGSLESALMNGFLCRLCSKLSRYVIFIFSEEGQQMRLTEKINSYLPVTVTREDRLPKTICMECIVQLTRHHKMMTIVESINTHIQPKPDQNTANDAPKT